MSRKPYVLPVVVALITCWLALTPFQSQARSVVPVEGAGFNTAMSLADNLKSHIGQNVFITLKSGNSFQGYIKSVGDNLLHLEKLAGKDFYDALIRIDEINAMEAKFREMK
ncbi:MAG: hypothetical protein P8X63_07415 [Desulfuromonadaceae bacterium]